MRAVHVTPSKLDMILPESPTAKNVDMSGAHVMPNHCTLAVEVRAVQLIPSGLVITRFEVPVLDTEARRASSGDQQILPHKLFTPGGRLVHVMASVLVAMTPDPHATATPSSGDQHTPYNDSPDVVRPVQFMPSGLVMTLFVFVSVATAMKRESPGAQHTEFHDLSAAEVPAVHVMPSALVTTRLPVPVLLTATKSASCGDQHTDIQLLALGLVRAVHVMALGLVAIVPVCDTITNNESSATQTTPHHHPLVAELLVQELRTVATRPELGFPRSVMARMLTPPHATMLLCHD